MDTTILTLIVGGVIVNCVLIFLFRGRSGQPVIKESVDGAVVEKCPHCDGVVGVSLKVGDLANIREG
jgi:hypothetical protein